MNSALIGAIAASVGVPIVFAILGKLFPPSNIKPTGPSLDELRKRFATSEILFGLCYIIACVPITLVLWAGLRGLSTWHASLLPSASLVLTAMPVYWLLLAMFLSMACVDPPMTLVLRRVLGERYPDYQRYQALKYRMNSDKVSRLFITGVSTLCAVGILLGLNWYVLVTDSEVVINRYLSLTEERHAFSRIERIRTAPKLVAPNGNVVSRREYVVTFAEGERWSTDDLPAHLDDDAKRALIQGLSDRSNIPIEEVAVFQRGEW